MSLPIVSYGFKNGSVQGLELPLEQIALGAAAIALVGRALYNRFSYKVEQDQKKGEAYQTSFVHARQIWPDIAEREDLSPREKADRLFDRLLEGLGPRSFAEDLSRWIFAWKLEEIQGLEEAYLIQYPEYEADKEVLILYNRIKNGDYTSVESGSGPTLVEKWSPMEKPSGTLAERAATIRERMAGYVDLTGVMTRNSSEKAVVELYNAFRADVEGPWGEVPEITEPLEKQVDEARKWIEANRSILFPVGTPWTAKADESAKSGYIGLYCTNALYRELYRVVLESPDVGSIFEQRDYLLSSGEKTNGLFDQVVAKSSSKKIGMLEKRLDDGVVILYAELGLVDTGLPGSGTSFINSGDYPVPIHQQLQRAVPALTGDTDAQQAAQARTWIAANQIVLDQIQTFMLSCFKHEEGELSIPPEYSKFRNVKDRQVREAVPL